MTVGHQGRGGRSQLRVLSRRKGEFRGGKVEKKIPFHDGGGGGGWNLLSQSNDDVRIV